MALDLDLLRGTFFDECAELMDSVYGCLAALGDGTADSDTIHGLFRAVHSIKGGAGVFGFQRLISFTHVAETLLDLMRSGTVAVDAPGLALLLRAADTIADLLAAARDNIEIDSPAISDLRAELVAAAGTAPESHETACSPTVARAAGWRIEFRPHAAMFRSANEPLLLVRELGRLGPLTVTVDASRLPDLDRLEPEDAYFGWRFDLAADVARARIEEVFEFVADDCDLTVDPLPSGPVATAPPADLTEPEIQPAYDESLPTPARPDPAQRGVQSVRVDVAKVDRLVNLVGELVINQAMLVQLGSTLPPGLCPDLVAGLETLSQHLRDLQEGVMAIRTQPVKSVFGRMPRLVRELSAQLGKETRLVITGEGTEIDKTVVEQLADPLTHLLRNALDHGIEPPEARVAAGKPAQGTIRLGAEQRSGRIIIEVSDDGRGIDRGRVLARARARDLIAPDAQLCDSEIDELIFLPGFSTAETVSDVSGRGVGMDVVRRNIQSLGGRIALESSPQTGSRFVLSLPLTLAVLDGLVVSVGADAYIVPLTAIVESLRPRREDIHSIAGGGEVLAIRGSYIPLLMLHRRFGIANGITDAARGIVVIVDTDTSGRLGLVVDDLVGQRQVVVKSLEANYGPVPGISGATILGDGRVALILDIAGLRAGDHPATALSRAA